MIDRLLVLFSLSMIGLAVWCAFYGLTHNNNAIVAANLFNFGLWTIITIVLVRNMED